MYIESVQRPVHFNQRDKEVERLTRQKNRWGINSSNFPKKSNLSKPADQSLWKTEQYEKTDLESELTKIVGCFQNSYGKNTSF